MPKPPPPWLERAARVLDEDGQRAYSTAELHRVLVDNHAKMQLPESYGPREVAKALLSSGLLRLEEISPLSRPKGNDGSEYRVIERYILKDASAIHVALSLRPNSFLSHASAAQHLGLALASPERVYVNKEQSPKPEHAGSLSQEAIDRAFSNAPRTSNLIYGFKKTEIVLLAGKNTKNHGVASSSGKLGKKIPVTSLERTLVDMTVRPAYSGGVQVVLDAFLAARKMVSVPKIIAALKALDYTYPYHQAVGFYLQRSGLSAVDLASLKKLQVDFNFYLANQLSEPKLDRNWRVYYPADLYRERSATKTRTPAGHRPKKGM
jgi:predicted transcriptional regulator of viral defense system